MKRVIIESPYGSKDPAIVERNRKFLHECCKDALARGEAPFASHGFYTLFLDDNDKPQRTLGMECGHTWMQVCDYVVVYVDLGITAGMEAGMKRAEMAGKPVTLRSLRGETAVEMPHPDVMPIE